MLRPTARSREVSGRRGNRVSGGELMDLRELLARLTF